MATYFKVFGSKPVCFRDVQMFLPHLPSDAAVSICKAYETVVTQESEQSEVCTDVTHHKRIAIHKVQELSVKAVYRRVLLEKLKTKYKLYENLNNEKTQALVEEYLRIYRAALEIPSALSLKESERQYADDLIVLASHLYIDLYLRNGKF